MSKFYNNILVKVRYSDKLSEKGLLIDNDKLKAFINESVHEFLLDTIDLQAREKNLDFEVDYEDIRVFSLKR